MPILPVPFRSNASRRAWLSVGAPILGLVLLIIASSLVLLASFAQRQDRDFREDSRHLVASAIDARLRAAADVALDFGLWDAAREAVRGRINQAWLEENYRSNVADALVVFRPGESSLYFWHDPAIQRGAGELLRRTRLAASRLHGLEGLVHAPRSRAAVSTVAAFGDQLALIGVAPVTVENGDARRAQRVEDTSYLASVSVLRSADLAELGALLGLSDMQFTPLGGELAPHSVSLPITAPDGAVAGHMVWRDEQPGTSTLRGQVWLVVSGLLLAGLLTFVCARSLAARQTADTVRAEAALESSRLKSEFISTMSHELRTPLNAIIGYGELIEEEAAALEPSAQTISQDIGRVLIAARHLNRLVNDTLDQARIDAGSLPLNVEPLDVGSLLAEAAEIMKPLALANGDVITVRVASKTPPAFADHVRLRQCLLNLIGNAVTFTHGGEIRLHARAVYADGAVMVAIDVVDTGIGIARAQHERVFAPYVRSDKGAPEGGAGLGLSISRKLARAMNGDIKMRSELGKGSTFTITVPAATTGRALESA